LLHSPKVLFLDEPTIGLDINVKIKMREFIKKINEERGVSVMLTTHDLQDIETLAKRIVVINHGTACFDGTYDELAEKYTGGKHTVSFTLQEEAETIELPEGLKDKVDISRNGRHVTLVHEAQVSSSDILGEILRKYSISGIDIHGPQIEDVVMEVYNS
ncbi:MAG: hypothetical protein HUJ93_08740, partial [Bacteroidales bacterium]|nr:hypothetical protein [Bacteroidales bacterium]